MTLAQINVNSNSGSRLTGREKETPAPPIEASRPRWPIASPLSRSAISAGGGKGSMGRWEQYRPEDGETVSGLQAGHADQHHREKR